MAITVEAVYENGVLKLSEPVPFRDHERVRVTIEPAVSRVRQTAGLIGWSGSAEELEQFLNDPDESVFGSPNEWFRNHPTRKESP